MMKILRQCFFPMILVFILCEPIHAGVTGTLSGHITNSETHEPLPGVNIMVKNTNRGAVTDTQGFYIITNLKPGKYTIEASMMGFQSIAKTDVYILTDLRTKIDFNLTTKILQMDAVQVTADAPLVRTDITATTHFISEPELRNIPVLTFQEIVDLQPGVVSGHIRGGRRTEVMYLVDGIPVREAIEGKAGSELPNSSIIDMTVQTGGFNAEYGDAMSGIVNIITRDGGDKLKGKLEVSALDGLNNPSPIDDSNPEPDQFAEFNFGGPLFTQKLKFFLSGNIIYPYSRWKDEQFGNRMVVMALPGSYNWNINSKLSWALHESFKVTGQYLLSIWDWTEYDNKWRYNLEGLPPRSKKSYRVSLSATHTVSDRTFYSIRISQYNVMKSIIGLVFRSQPDIIYADINGDGIEDQTDWRGYVIAGSLPWWLDHQEIQTMAMADLTQVLGEHHQVKAGIEGTYYDLYKKNVQALYIPTADSNFPQFITYDTEYRYFPWKMAGYLQDKMDFDGLVVNAGLRLDYFNPRASRPALENQLVGNRETWILNYDEMVIAKPKSQLSPRLGVAFPITETAVIHLNYGWFFQMPLFDYLYTNSNYNQANGFSPLGDPDLKPAKTVLWEVSCRGEIAQSTMVDVTLFKKEASNLVDANTFKNTTTNDIYRSSGYTRFVNLSMVNIQGLEVYVKRDYSQNISGKISYTYMIGTGTGSSSFEKFNWLQQGYRVPNDQYYLSWDQRHTFVFNLDLKSPRWGGVNLLWRFNSAFPYTLDLGVITSPNNARMEPTTTLDVRLHKSFNLGKRTDTYVFAEGLNLFNHQNILWVDDTGHPGGLLDDPGAFDYQRRVRVGLGLNF